MNDLWSHSHDWDNGYAKGHKDGYQQGRADAVDDMVLKEFKCDECCQKGRADSEIIRKVFSKMEQPNNCLFNNMSACCYPISDCMNCPITIDEMKGAGE